MAFWVRRWGKCQSLNDNGFQGDKVRRGKLLILRSVYWLAVVVFGLVVGVVSPLRVMAAKVEGPNACVECHKKEGSIWKNTHHHSTFRDMPRSKKAREIGRKMKIKRMKASSLCLGCHFTSQKVKKKKKAIAGISCESCHGAGKNYIKVHAEFSGKKNKESESKAEARQRWVKSEKAGMIRPTTIYRLAKNCYSCHVVPREDLVNVGGHPAGSKFELYSWSQGEIRHNVWYSKGKSNPVANAKRRRKLFIVGLAVELETALRAVGGAKKRKAYAVRMALRADAARKKLAAAAKALPDVGELSAMVQFGHSAGLKLDNADALTNAADGVASEAKKFEKNHDGSALAGIDSLIPGSDKFKGKPSG